MANKQNIAIIGGGPAGLFAAEIIADKGNNVTIYDRMASPARKLLIAGRGGLNLTHSEPLEKFIPRYGDAASWIAPYINNFTPQDLRNWCDGLGQESFIGSSGRIFPRNMKAVGLLRAWLKRLEELNVKYAARHYWHGWEGDTLKFTDVNNNKITVKADAVLLALGGASWPRLGSDGGWVSILKNEGVEVATLKPTNCGWNVNWSEYFSSRFAGIPLKSISVTHKDSTHLGEAMITNAGIEGGVIYALSSAIRKSAEVEGSAKIQIDLRPNMSVTELANKLGERGNQSLSNYLRKSGFAPVVISLLHETTPQGDLAKYTAQGLAVKIKNISITLNSSAGMARAISTAGGIDLNELDKNLMLTKKPGVFACGEMLDWEAPTGGYLLQGCFSSAFAAAGGILEYCRLT